MRKSVIFLIICFQIGIVCIKAQISGCTDPKANNYNPTATINDGSCTYDPFNISPSSTSQLSSQINESSGLILWDGFVWTHNDNSDTKLYALDTIYADIIQSVELKEVENQDWEEISQDDEHIYIGDFGNNSGTRTNLHILRAKKGSLKLENQDIDTIWFSYEDQFDFSQPTPNATDFDCEAMIVTDDSIYLFTKQWISAGTVVYSIPKTPGNHVASRITTYNIQGLVTGATYISSLNLLVVCGYTSLLHPFFSLHYDFENTRFFSGNNRRVTVALPFHQVEGITSMNGLKYYVSNESFVLQPAANNPQKLHVFNLEQLLGDYVENYTSSARTRHIDAIRVYPNPVKDYMTVKISEGLYPTPYTLSDLSARVMLKGTLMDASSHIDMRGLNSGTYTLSVDALNNRSVKVVKF